MIDLTLWVLHRSGEVRRDAKGYLFFDTQEEALTFWKCCVPLGDNGWRPKKVRVTDAK